MAQIGSGAVASVLSYVAVGREIAYGTAVTTTAGLNFLSCSMKTTKETKVIEEIVTERTYRNSIQTGRNIEGEIEFNYSPLNLASNYILQNAFGGGGAAGVTASGETVGGLGFTHTFSIANFDVTYASLYMNIRKGDTLTGKVFEYSGLRVNELTMSAEIDEPLKMNVALIGQNSTQTTNDVASAIASSTLTQTPLSFVNGRFSVESTMASITSSVFWHVQKMEFKVSNNLKSDNAVRRIGTDTLQALPAGPATFELSCTIRFDTTTAYNHMLNGDNLAAEFEFLGATMTGSAIRSGIKLTMPKVQIIDAGDPEIGGPDEVLTSDVTFLVLRDVSSSGGYAVQAKVTNLTSTYA